MTICLKACADHTQPRDPEFNAAVLAITANLFPNGFDVVASEDAPNTWQDLRDHVDRTGRMAVSGSADPEDVFRDDAVYHAFRAWHDHVHLFIGAEFTLFGEACAARCQQAQLAAMFGEAKANRWMGYVHAEIITANFGTADAIDPASIRLG